LVNLALALAVAEPLTAAPQAVMGHRAVAVRQPPFLQPEHMGRTARLLAAAAVFGGEGGLGDDLERLVELLTNPEQDALAVLAEAEFSVRLVVDPRHPQAVVRYRSVDLPGSPVEQLHYGTPDPEPPLILREVVLNIRLFGVLAELWDHTQRYRAAMPLGTLMAVIRRDTLRANRREAKRQSLSPPGTPASVAPENENAASPAREAASTRDQSTARTNGKPGQLPTPERRRESEIPQALPYRRTGRGSPQWSDRDDEESSAAAGAP